MNSSRAILAEGEPSGRRRILERLGIEAADPLDEFLAQALEYERGHVASLQGFLHWLAASDSDIKRDMEGGEGGRVRVMTVHGSKGLQAAHRFHAGHPAAATRHGEDPVGRARRWRAGSALRTGQAGRCSRQYGGEGSGGAEAERGNTDGCSMLP